jgi:hypothetical protein
MKIYIGIDNGTTGSIGILSENKEICEFLETPSKKEQSYTKTKQNISRIDFPVIYKLLEDYKDSSFAIIERPLVNPKMFKTTMSAMRALEATLCAIEGLEIAHQYIDSKQWQKELLPQGTKGSVELKKASKEIGIRLFPQHKELIEKHKDADGILIAEFARRNNL